MRCRTCPLEPCVCTDRCLANRNDWCLLADHARGCAEQVEYEKNVKYLLVRLSGMRRLVEVAVTPKCNEAALQVFATVLSMSIIAEALLEGRDPKEAAQRTTANVRLELAEAERRLR